MLKLIPTIIVLFFLNHAGNAQSDSTTEKNKKLSIHLQATIIPQYHFNFKAAYSGDNSLEPSEPARTSFSTTLFLSYKPFRNS